MSLIVAAFEYGRSETSSHGLGEIVINSSSPGIVVPGRVDRGGINGLPFLIPS